MFKFWPVLLVYLLAYTVSVFAQSPIQSPFLSPMSKPTLQNPTTHLRWTQFEDTQSDINYIAAKISKSVGFPLTAADFKLTEERPMATLIYRRYAQVAGSEFVEPSALRVWVDFTSGKAIQVEANVANSSAIKRLLAQMSTLSISEAKDWSDADLHEEVRKVVSQNGYDNQVLAMKFNDRWIGTVLVREFEVRGRRGKHFIQMSVFSKVTLSYHYKPFAPADWFTSNVSDQQFPVKLYRYGEALEGQPNQLLQREDFYIGNFLQNISYTTVDPFLALKTRHYLESQMNYAKSLTPEGKAQGFWSVTSVYQDAQALTSQLPTRVNSFPSGGLFLQGIYTDINIHPESLQKFPGVRIPHVYGSHMIPSWKDLGGGTYEMVPLASYLGKMITNPTEAYQRDATRHPQHDPAFYMNQGFDELQVYFAVNQLFQSLHKLGFLDPDLSTRPFHSFLYDPDIAMKDNAYYTDDTINFTTYSPTQPNYARDNPTIWHELGHGVMDRLMGPYIHIEGNGGLDEGMADFVAAIVMSDVSGGQPIPGGNNFRIQNKTGFFLTNEAHDEGESYGGSMNDMMELSMKKWGRQGLVKMADLTLQTMRLSRDNPSLTVADWFQRMLFADQLGQPGVRNPQEMSDLILAALSARNFAASPERAAGFHIFQENQEVQYGLGTRNQPIQLKMAQTDQKTFQMSAKLQSVVNYQFTYPVTVKVTFRDGPLQGAVHWVGEENGPLTFVVNDEKDWLKFPLTVTGKCDEVNREDHSCADFAYLQVYNRQDNGPGAKPVAKKRFYVQIHN